MLRWLARDGHARHVVLLRGDVPMYGDPRPFIDDAKAGEVGRSIADLNFWLSERRAWLLTPPAMRTLAALLALALLALALVRPAGAPRPAHRRRVAALWPAAPPRRRAWPDRGRGSRRRPDARARERAARPGAGTARGRARQGRAAVHAARGRAGGAGVGTEGHDGRRRDDARVPPAARASEPESGGGAVERRLARAARFRRAVQRRRRAVSYSRSAARGIRVRAHGSQA